LTKIHLIGFHVEQIYGAVGTPSRHILVFLQSTAQFFYRINIYKEQVRVEITSSLEEGMQTTRFSRAALKRKSE
jgi:hypothetical protein